MFKKWINKQTITVFIMTFIVTSMFPIYAVTKQTIDVTYRNIKISVNGTTAPSDEEPFIYNGRTFLPVRAVAEALNKDVKYNETTDTVEITDKIATGEEVKALSETTIQDVSTKITKTPDGITHIDTWNGNQYIGVLYVRNKIREKGYNLTEKWQLTKGNDILIDNVPVTMMPEFGYEGVEANYYINTILPLIK